MFTHADVQILADQLSDGAVRLINKKTKISKPTIYKFLRGEVVRSESAQRIYSATLSIIEQSNTKEDKLRQKSQKILKPSAI